MISIAKSLRVRRLRDIKVGNCRANARPNAWNHAIPAILTVFLALGVWPVGAQTNQENTAPDTIEQRLLACAMCHGEQGEGLRGNEYYPRLAGKPAGYLFNQLHSFRETHRKHEMMSYMVRFLSDDYLREMAEYYSTLRPPYPPPTSAAENLLSRGKALVTEGDPSRKIPSCIACHGKKLTGMEPAIPGLVGLRLRYISSQMGAWQTGRRKAHYPDCMGQIASRLKADDISAISAWLAAQPASPDTPPLPANSLELPMECGGVQ